MAKDRITPLVLQSIPYDELTNDFVVVSEDGFEGPLSYLRVQNSTSLPIEISYDGVYSHEYIFPTDDVEVHAQGSNHLSNRKSLFKKYTKVYVKISSGGPAKSGIVLISGFYQ